ncbi:hypothetical protein FUAX_54900 (plasmid) [Fulvitalea axinellae]|uniref:Uncharacterized protein n=1 Tax=Fulvitalea axinellae TaxID=1182444 RepID=A0AAU9DAU9_9BACT|nr:hypothetical protein FUAX_54900 [Fulvitalea axinellae]
MILKTKTCEFEIGINDNILFHGKPKFNPYGPCVILSNYNTYQEIHLDPNVFGSMRFMMSENDILTFSQSNGLLNAVELEIPYNVQIIEDAYEPICKQTINLVARQDKSFFLEQAISVKYFTSNDFMLFEYENHGKPYDTHHLKLVDDFYTVINSNTIIGWGIENCGKYLYDSYRKNYDTIESDKRTLIVDFLSLYTEETFELIEHGDNNVKAKFLKLHAESKKLKSNVMCGVIEDWLDLDPHHHKHPCP